jgi:signal transduction histidine kinase
LTLEKSGQYSAGTLRRSSHRPPRPREAVSIDITVPVDPARLEQMLQLHERVLLGSFDAAALEDRICQSTALVLGAAGARLVRLATDDRVHGCGAWGDPFAASDDEAVRRAVAECRPLVHADAPEANVLTLPLAAEHGSFAMQLRPSAGNLFTLEHVGLARYAATLAAVALKHARERHAGPATAGATEILASLSHDLRQPLNVMLGYTQLLIDDTYGPCSTEQREVLGTIERHARELHTVLSGALDLVRMEAQPASVGGDPFPVAEVLRELCTGSLAHRAGHDVALTWHVDAATPPLRSDRFRIRQVLQNLIDNALRHTEHGEVAVTAAPHERSVRLQVSDTGSGIAADDLPHVFVPFRTGSQGRTGSGLGLYIVKRFCESLGGSVSVTSTVGSGTRFTIDLPSARP